MAQGFCFVCGKCDHTIVAWDDCPRQALCTETEKRTDGAS